MNRLGIIVPYRNREEHLKKFIPHIDNFIKNKINYQIIIVEQFNDKPFNRGKLLNIGFDYLKDECDWFCFHDIDMLPVDNNCDYSYIDGVCKLSYYVSQFNFIPRPETELGGVTLIDKISFISINGYNNNYWGWGVEDNDFALRCNLKNIKLSYRPGRYMSLSHKPNGDTYGDNPSPDTLKNRNLFNNIKQNKNNFMVDGISNLEYKILDKINKNFILLKVDL